LKLWYVLVRQEKKLDSNECLNRAKNTSAANLDVSQHGLHNRRMGKDCSWSIPCSKSIAEKLDTKDGGLEGVFGGPPLVGMFESTLEALNLGVDTQIE
jgi:hypothetical protein